VTTPSHFPLIGAANCPTLGHLRHGVRRPSSTNPARLGPGIAQLVLLSHRSSSSLGLCASVGPHMHDTMLTTIPPPAFR